MTGRKVRHTTTVNGLKLYQRERPSPLETEEAISKFRGAQISDKTRKTQATSIASNTNVGKLSLGGE